MRPPSEPPGPPDPPGPLFPEGFFGGVVSGLCTTISSCFYVLCCCWLLHDCFGSSPQPAGPPGPSPPPPPAPGPPLPPSQPGPPGGPPGPP